MLQRSVGGTAGVISHGRRGLPEQAGAEEGVRREMASQ